MQLSGKVFAVLSRELFYLKITRRQLKQILQAVFRIFIVLIEVLRFLSFSLFEKRRKISSVYVLNMTRFELKMTQ